jgi:translation initiation factor 1
MSDGKLVYSTDPSLNKKCAKCKEVVSECKCAPEAVVKPGGFTALLRIEKQGRGGKTVSVVDGLPKVNVFLKDLTKQLKNACGSGGTFLMDGKEGVIEIQGDKREQIRAFLAKKGIKTKG